MGIVEEVGPGERIKVGDRVSVPFNIACGTCRNCTAGWTSFCLRPIPRGRPWRRLRLREHGSLRRRPGRVAGAIADFNLLELPKHGQENDFTMLSDIFPTG